MKDLFTMKFLIFHDLEFIVYLYLFSLSVIFFLINIPSFLLYWVSFFCILKITCPRCSSRHCIPHIYFLYCLPYLLQMFPFNYFFKYLFLYMLYLFPIISYIVQRLLYTSIFTVVLFHVFSYLFIPPPLYLLITASIFYFSFNLPVLAAALDKLLSVHFPTT